MYSRQRRSSTTDTIIAQGNGRTRSLRASDGHSAKFVVVASSPSPPLLLLLLLTWLFGQLTAVAAECGPDPCYGMFCLGYGRQFDADGCVLCACLHPCMDVQCASNEECRPTLVDDCDGVRCNKYTGICVAAVPSTTRRPCTPLNCTAADGSNTHFCRFGFKSDAAGCETCQCFDPCESLNCPRGQRCQLTADDCLPGDNCRDAPMPYCTDTASSSSTASFPTSSASSEVTTTTTPLPQSPTAEPSVVTPAAAAAILSSSPTQCPPPPVYCVGLVCAWGRMYDSSGCDLCICLLPCSGVICSAGQTCQPQPVRGCNGDGCNAYHGVCVAGLTTTHPPCPSRYCTTASSSSCRFGLKLDHNGCPTCQCYDPCASYTCPPGSQCRLTADDCLPGQNCRDAPMPYCAEPSSASLVSTPTNTTATMTTLSNAVGMSTIQLPHQCPPDECLDLLICMFGRKYDSDGCVLSCTCFEPCSHITCIVGQICRPVKVEGCTGEDCPAYQGQCTELSIPSTPVLCPPLNCTTTSCRFGAKLDDNRCPTCQCYSPCETYACPPGKICRLTADDCSHGTNCREAAMPECADLASNSSSTMSATTAIAHLPAVNGSFEDCCLSANLDEECISFCSSKVPPESYEDMMFIPVPSQCLNILQCAADSVDRRNCCASRGISTECLGMCSGSGSIIASSVNSSCLVHFYEMLSCIARLPLTLPSTTAENLVATAAATQKPPVSVTDSSTSTPSTVPSVSTPPSSSVTAATETRKTPSLSSTSFTSTTAINSPLPLPSETTSSSVSSSSSSSSTAATTTTTRESVNVTASTREHQTTMVPQQNILIAMSVIRIFANYDIIVNETDFKQQMIPWISKYISVNEGAIRVTDLKSGSILVLFEVMQSPNVTVDVTQLMLAFMQWDYDVPVTYNGRQYQATLDGYKFLVSVSTAIPPTVPPTSKMESKPHSFVLLIVLVCVLVPIGLAAIVVITFIAWKKVRGEPVIGHKRLEVSSSDTSTTSDSLPKATFNSLPQYMMTIEPSTKVSQYETYA